MNSQLLSVGKYCLVLVSFVLATLGLAGCSGMKTVDRPESMSSSAQPSEVKSTGANGEVSLAGDRKSIEEMRKNIPEPVRTENDLLRETLNMMGGEVKERPEKIRNRFNKQMRKMRNKYTKESRKKREKHKKEARKKRERFLKELKKEREDFNDRKPTREQRKDFYNEQDEKRKEFFADERDKQKDFTSTMREESNDFNAMVRDRNRAFNREHRIYKKKYDEHQKLKKTAEQRIIIKCLIIVISQTARHLRKSLNHLRRTSK